MGLVAVSVIIEMCDIVESRFWASAVRNCTDYDTSRLTASRVVTKNQKLGSYRTCYFISTADRGEMEGWDLQRRLLQIKLFDLTNPNAKVCIRGSNTKMTVANKIATTLPIPERNRSNWSKSSLSYLALWWNLDFDIFLKRGDWEILNWIVHFYVRRGACTHRLMVAGCKA